MTAMARDPGRPARDCPACARPGHRWSARAAQRPAGNQPGIVHRRQHGIGTVRIAADEGRFQAAKAGAAGDTPAAGTGGNRPPSGRRTAAARRAAPARSPGLSCNAPASGRTRPPGPPRARRSPARRIPAHRTRRCRNDPCWSWPGTSPAGAGTGSRPGRAARSAPPSAVPWRTAAHPRECPAASPRRAR